MYVMCCMSMWTLLSTEAGDPTLTELVQISLTTVRVTWSPPPPPPSSSSSSSSSVTGYTVHYTRDGDSARTKDVGSTTSTEITGLTVDRTYTISVEATANGLSGESEEMIITLSE